MGPLSQMDPKFIFSKKDSHSDHLVAARILCPSLSGVGENSLECPRGSTVGLQRWGTWFLQVTACGTQGQAPGGGPQARLLEELSLGPGMKEKRAALRREARSRAGRLPSLGLGGTAALTAPSHLFLLFTKSRHHPQGRPLAACCQRALISLPGLLQFLGPQSPCWPCELNEPPLPPVR